MPITPVPPSAVDPVAQVVAALEAATATLAATALTLADKGSWLTSTAYAVGDVVTQSGQRYCCRTAHTSGTFATDLAASKWVSLDAVASSRTITAGTGLTGGGDLSADRTLAVSYGTTSGTAAQGNDSRITGALQASNNLSDVTAASARTNLGLGTAATISSTAGGDLSGTLPSPTVARVNGVSVSGTPSSGQVLLASSSSASAWSAQPASKYLDHFQAYNITATSMRKWRTAYAKAKNGEARAHIVCLGDSVTSGYRSTSPQYTNSWPARVKALVDTLTGVTTGTGFVKPPAADITGTAGEDAGENRFSFTGTWGTRSSGLFQADRYSSTAGVLTIGPITCDRIRVYYLKYSGGGTATTTLDGSAGASINGNQGSGFGVNSVDYTAAQGSHTLVITAPTGTDFILLGWDAFQNGTTTGVRVSNAGYNGRTAANVSATSSAGSLAYTGPALVFDTLLPDLLTISFGLNEANVATSKATFKQSVQDIITRAGSSCSKLLIVPPPPATSNGEATFLPGYVDAYYELADTNDLPLIDFSKRWTSDAISSVEGFKYDGQHPNSRGYWDMGHAVSAALMATVIV